MYRLQRSLWYLPDPRGAGHVETFQFNSSVCVCVCSFKAFYCAKLIVPQSLGLGIWRLRDFWPWGLGDWGIWGLGDLEIWGFGDWGIGGLEDWRIREQEDWGIGRRGWDILMGHFYKTFWWGILIRNFDEIFWWHILIRYFDDRFL